MFYLCLRSVMELSTHSKFLFDIFRMMTRRKRTKKRKQLGNARRNVQKLHKPNRLELLKGPLSPPHRRPRQVHHSLPRRSTLIPHRRLGPQALPRNLVHYSLPRRNALRTPKKLDPQATPRNHVQAHPNL
jgi:hypothetical protein